MKTQHLGQVLGHNKPVRNLKFAGNGEDIRRRAVTMTPLTFLIGYLVCKPEKGEETTSRGLSLIITPFNKRNLPGSSSVKDGVTQLPCNGPRDGPEHRQFGWMPSTRVSSSLQVGSHDTESAVVNFAR
jgi:hypothetical protein